MVFPHALLLLASGLLCIQLAGAGAASDPCYSGSHPFTEAQYPRCSVITSDAKVFWRIDGDDITIALYVRSSGWVGFGITPSGGMKGADIALFIQNSNGNYELRDMFSKDFAIPSVDVQKDKELVPGSYGQANGYTWFAFKRPMETCNAEDVAIGTLPVDVIYAFGTSHSFAQHRASNRGGGQISFRVPREQHHVPETDAKHLIVRSPPFVVPAVSTRYQCSFHRLPIDRKRHIVQTDALLSSKLVHHMILYVCDRDLNITDTWDCTNRMPSGCEDFFVGWAVGPTKATVPSVAGYPMGPSDTRYVVLQTHFDNPALTAGVVDESGFNLTYTETLRPHDMGTLILGTFQQFLSIPPGRKSYHYENECPMECTNKFPATGINVIGNTMHMHLRGSRIWTQHIRGNQELPPLGTPLDYYDFNFQASRPVNATVLPGDRLIHHCVYNTEADSKQVYGGDATNEEMCYSFLSYYPKVNMRACSDFRDLGGTFSSGVFCDGNFRFSIDTVTWPAHPPFRTHNYVPRNNCSLLVTRPLADNSGSNDNDFLGTGVSKQNVVLGVGALSTVVFVSFLLFRARRYKRGHVAAPSGVTAENQDDAMTKLPNLHQTSSVEVAQDEPQPPEHTGLVDEQQDGYTSSQVRHTDLTASNAV